MKVLLVALQLSLTPPVPVPGAEAAVSTPQPENQKTVTIDFEDDSIDDDLVSPEWDGYSGCGWGRPSRLVRIREDFDDKVMQSVAEM
jgi:hypothetical protein